MKNDKIYPFTRNRYFYGKLLTVRDFEIEQRYFNDKRRMTNRLAVGTGILSGLDVVAVNDRTISIDPGIAIDSFGREIIVSLPAMHMLSDLEGFDSDKILDTYYLCMAYDELPTEMVHSVAQTSGDGEYSRLNESYSFSLRPDYTSSVELLRERLLHTRYNVYDADELKVDLVLYDIVSTQASFEAEMIVERKAEGIPVAVRLALQGTYINNGRPIELNFEGDDKLPYGVYSVKANISTDQLKPVVDTIKLSTGSFDVLIGEREIERAVEISHQVEVIETNIRQAIHSRYYELPFDELMQAKEDDAICLAKINLIPAGDTYLIDSIHKPDSSEYVIPHALGTVLDELALPEKKEKVSLSKQNINEDALMDRVEERVKHEKIANVRTGVFTFSQPEARTQERALFSDEIDHGLGRGEGFLTFAIEHAPDVVDDYGSARQVFFGDSSVFEDSAYASDQPDLKVSGVLYPNKGSFRMALSGDLRAINRPIRVRWRLEKMSSETDQPISDNDPLRIDIVPNPGRVLPRQSILLEAFNKDGEPVICTWKVAGEEAGAIDENGLYTAPAKEGVYTITATSDRGYETTGYIVVENE